MFHVADQPRAFDDCWYTAPDAFVPTIEPVFLWVPAALGLADLILNDVLERQPPSCGSGSLSSARSEPRNSCLCSTEFTSRLNGRPPTGLRLGPTEYFVRHVRVSSFAYEDPRRLTTRSGDLFMRSSDHPHSRHGHAAHRPCDGWRRPEVVPRAFHDNVTFLSRN